jgi:predicted ATPase
VTSLNQLIESLTEIINNLETQRLNNFIKLKVICLFNSLIEKVKHEVSAKTGTPKKPSATGFYDYALNRINIERAVKYVLQNIDKMIAFSLEYIGCLDEKGDLFCKTEIVIQDGNISDGRYQPIENVKKGTQKKFSNAIRAISDALYTAQLFHKISELNEIEEIDSIPTVLELLMFEKYFILNEERYKPSTGESSMLLLHKELKGDKDVYILDEPEKSLGNEYINNVIVPLIKEKAKASKKIFIATHDANIAVRTLPYNSIYRVHKKDHYETFVGNPFINHLENIRNEADKIDWKEISMRTLEGGRNAFGERGQIYGNL